MKKAIYILSTLAFLMASCSTHRNMTFNDSLLIGNWEQPNVTLDFKANGHYNYLYKDDGYSNKQSGIYFADKDSVVLYGFYPQAYTPESKNVR
mgnify:CR=1 FL=1